MIKNGFIYLGTRRCLHEEKQTGFRRLDTHPILRIFGDMSRTLFHFSLIFFLIFTLQFSGCGDPAPRPDPVEERFKEYYAGETIQREISRLGDENLDTLESRLESIRTRFGFSAAETDSLLGAVRESLPRWEAFLNDVLGRIEKRERELSPDSLHPKRNATPPAG